jgi:DNA-directed RNA polymerase specialized sigma24 family protein
MNLREPSTHLNRDDKPQDPLEQILEPWGVWRQWGVDGLSSKRKSPLEGYNSLERAFTDEIDKKKKAQIRAELIKLNYKDNLNDWVNQYFREWKYRISQLKVSRETVKITPITPNYGGHKYYSKIDRALSEIYLPYYNILIRKYEDQWEYKDFAKHYGINENLASQRIFKARRAARKILRKNGYKA